MNPRHPPTECCAYAQAAADYEKNQRRSHQPRRFRPTQTPAPRKSESVRTRLFAGGKWIRTLGPSVARGFHAVENVDVRLGRRRRLRKGRVRGQPRDGKSRGTSACAGRSGPTPRAGNPSRGYPPSATVALTELGSDVPKSPAGNGSIGGSRDCAIAAGQTTRTGNNAVRDNPTI